jgi:hypothetical protein
MGQTRSREQEKAEFVRAAETLYDELRTWRGMHPEASFDEMAAQVTPRRRELMGLLLKQLAQERDERIATPVCAQCGETMTYKGTPPRGVSHSEGEIRLERAYYYCTACGSTLFPPRPAAEVEEASLESPDDPPGAALGRGDRLV